MEIKKWKQISTSTFAVKVLLDSSNNAQRGDKTTPNYFYVPKFCNMLCITFIGLLHNVHIYRTQQSSFGTSHEMESEKFGRKGVLKAFKRSFG